MNLFEVENRIAIPSVHALIIEPFKTIWESDKSKTKIEAVQAFTYIELMCSRSKSNPFIGYSEIERPSKVAKEVYKDELYTPGKLVKEGIDKYNEFIENASPTLAFYRSALKAADTLKEFFSNINLEDRTNGGAAVYKPKDITNETEIKKIEQDLNKSFQSIYEIAAQHLVTHFRNSITIDFQNKLKTMFIDLLVAGQAFYRTRINNIGEDPELIVINPKDIFFYKNTNETYLNQTNRVVTREYLTR